MISNSNKACHTMLSHSRGPPKFVKSAVLSTKASMHQSTGQLVSSCFAVAIRLNISAEEHILFASRKIAHMNLLS